MLIHKNFDLLILIFWNLNEIIVSQTFNIIQKLFHTFLDFSELTLKSEDSSFNSTDRIITLGMLRLYWSFGLHFRCDRRKLLRLSILYSASLSLMRRRRFFGFEIRLVETGSSYSFLGLIKWLSSHFRFFSGVSTHNSFKVFESIK